MDRKTDITEMKITSNDGKNVADTTLLKPGAKDGLSGENSTESFMGSVSIKSVVSGPFGGLDKK